MAIIAVVSGSYCYGEEIVTEVSKRLNYRRVDGVLSEETSKRYKLGKDQVLRSMIGTAPFLNITSSKHKRSLGYLEATLAELLQSDNVVLSGCASYMIPGNISHVLKVCIIANHSFRVRQAVKIEDISDSEAATKIMEYDKGISSCSNHLVEQPAYDESLFDLVIPMHSTSVDEAVEIICNQSVSDAVKTTVRSRGIMEDYLLSAKVKLELTLAGHDANVYAENGDVTIEINEQAIRMGKLESKLKDIASTVPGVLRVSTKLGPKAAPPSLNPWDRIDVPPKILLVDDEKEFVHTLSERLRTRNLESSIAYDGEQALEMLNEEIPDVIVLDLMMPGIDGIETLRRVKDSHPDVEVIILTGHGSDEEQETAEDLGAFAYLHKPVNINDLAQKMKEAYAHGKRRR
ncbi:MAG: response regulator [FCB group bacterium]|nr:response regulator [FCB group bacterium]